jgi:hypothetical protein
MTVRGLMELLSGTNLDAAVEAVDADELAAFLVSKEEGTEVCCSSVVLVAWDPGLFVEYEGHVNSPATAERCYLITRLPGRDNNDVFDNLPGVRPINGDITDNRAENP